MSGLLLLTGTTLTYANIYDGVATEQQRRGKYHKNGNRQLHIYPYPNRPHYGKRPPVYFNPPPKYHAPRHYPTRWQRHNSR